MVCGAQVYGTDALARVILCRYLPHIAAMEFSGKYNVKGVRKLACILFVYRRTANYCSRWALLTVL